MGPESVPRPVLEEAAARSREEVPDDPAAVLAAARAAVVRERRATGVLDSRVPGFFEAQDLPRGEETADGPVVHGYDADGRLVLVTDPVRPNLTRYTAVAGEVQYALTERAGRLTLDRVGVTVHPAPGVTGLVNAARRDSWVAYLWRDDGPVTELTIWDATWPAPQTRPLTPAPEGPAGEAFPDGVEVAAARTLARVRPTVRADDRGVVVLLVTFAWKHADSLPPVLGVVLGPDAETFAAAADLGNGLDDGPDALLNPTLQEDYGFTSEYPYVADGVDEPTLGLPWPEAAIEANVLALVDALNQARSPEDPPFLAVDVEGEATRYLSRLPTADREALGAYGLTT